MSAAPLARPVGELVRAVRTGELSAVELVRAAEDAHHRAEAVPTPLHAFLSTDFAAAARAAHSAPTDGPLAGVPVAVKDNLCTLVLPTTCGSRLLEGYRSPYEATAVRRLTAAGAILVGKTNLDEFAMGSSTESSAFGPTLNPWDPSRVPGGSSGGSAAAVAAGIVPVALGSDTGGSIRQPAAFCGVVGVKPTYGRVSRYGLVGFASSLDQVGVLGRRVEDAARVLEAIAGPDPRDATCATHPVHPLVPMPGEGLEAVVVGVPTEYLPPSLDPRVVTLVHRAAELLGRAGAILRDVSLPATALALPAYCVLAPAEASSNLARFDGLRFGLRAREAASLDEVYQRSRALFGREVKRRVLLGTHLLSEGYHDAYHPRALEVRARVARDFDGVFSTGVHALLTPTTPAPAFGFGEHTSDPYSMYLSDVFTVPASLAGLPALSLPIGAVDGLPFGAQLIGRAWDEARLLRIASALERALAGTTFPG